MSDLTYSYHWHEGPPADGVTPEPGYVYASIDWPTVDVIVWTGTDWRRITMTEPARLVDRYGNLRRDLRREYGPQSDEEMAASRRRLRAMWCPHCGERLSYHPKPSPGVHPCAVALQRVEAMETL